MADSKQIRDQVMMRFGAGIGGKQLTPEAIALVGCIYEATIGVAVDSDGANSWTTAIEKRALGWIGEIADGVAALQSHSVTKDEVKYIADAIIVKHQAACARLENSDRREIMIVGKMCGSYTANTCG